MITDVFDQKTSQSDTKKLPALISLKLALERDAVRQKFTQSHHIEITLEMM